jgi:two-component system response regulator PilR (NtrC family)
MLTAGQEMQQHIQSEARVLLADDDQAIRQLVCTILQREGLEVDCVADGQEAIEKLQQHEYAVVLLDLMMPRVDGFGVVDHLIETQPRMMEKTVVMTAFPKAAAKERLHHLCCILSKPFEVAELVSLVRECAAR